VVAGAAAVGAAAAPEGADTRVLMRTPEFWQAFLSLGVSATRAHELLSEIGPACCTAEDLAVSPALSPSDRAKLKEAKALSPLQQSLLNVVSLDSRRYPTNLRHTQHPPPALMIRGDITEDDALSVAIVGTRRATGYGKAVARKLAQAFSEAGLTVVSGAAFGIDAEAHRSALEAGGRTIAVLGSGLDRPYPASHRGLLERVAESGAVVSQFALGTKPDWWNFPLRNHVIAGLARAVVVVEAPDKSGSLLTANLAAEEGRHVFATPGPIDSLEHRGSFRLINDGATLLFSPDQVFAALGVEKRVGKREPPKLSPLQTQIVERLSTRPELADNLSDALDQPAGVVLAELTRLEIEGVVAKSAGGYIKL
jgi:DNA processing protein